MGPKWHDFPLTDDEAHPVGSGGEFGGEHTTGWIEADPKATDSSPVGSRGVGKIVVCPTAVAPDAPPEINQADTFHYSAPLVPDGTPAQFADGKCSVAGYAPGGRYYAVGDDANGNGSTPPSKVNAVAAGLALIATGAALIGSANVKK